ncbi:MAG: DUF4954 family protein [Armatimonadetes bacterium]|nr:DUF4954 family protein [Armatimonadota bacterium]
MSSSSPSSSDIQRLLSQDCRADNWETVRFKPGCDLSRIRNVSFVGDVEVGETAGVHLVEGVEQPSGLYNACIANCVLGDTVRICNIGSAISDYVIEEGALLEHVASLVSEPGATFGNGVELEVVNEAGGRETKIINDLTSQVAYLQAMLKHDEVFSNRLSDLIDEQVASGRSEKGIVERGCRLLHCGPLLNVNIGPHAELHGVSFLKDGTVNSCSEHPTEVGDGVQAQSFIVSEGAQVDGGAILENVFVGQGARIGKQFSAQNSMFFANSEGFHGEACSVFGGPYTVTHHKSTLLIAGLFSFYNAGSGTNQSNHMYKLGPVHQGVLERGCKTGSSSYLLMESHVGAFSVVIGKHLANIDTPNLPFSYIYTDGESSKIIPGMNLFSVGTVRDGEKWPKRDRRKALNKRDLIVFDVYSPYTVEKMRLGRDELLALSESTSRDKQFVNYGGLQLSRVLLKKGAKYYQLAISRYLNDAVCSRLSDALRETGNWSDATALLKPERQLALPEEWTDLAGLLTPRERVNALVEKVSQGDLISYEELLDELEAMYRRYSEDAWEFVHAAYEKEYGTALQTIGVEKAETALEEWYSSANTLHSMILEDSKKEFSAFSQIGYGLDQDETNKVLDFQSVRGTIDTNSVIQNLNEHATSLRDRYTEIKDLLSKYR